MLALRTGQSMEWLYTAIHERRDLFDSLWYAAFPPKDPETAPETAEAGHCDIDAILRGDKG